jgi:hypothetical protein
MGIITKQMRREAKKNGPRVCLALKCHRWHWLGGALGGHIVGVANVGQSGLCFSNGLAL